MHLGNKRGPIYTTLALFNLSFEFSLLNCEQKKTWVHHWRKTLKHSKIDQLNTTRILHITNWLVRRYLNIDSIGKTFTERIMDGNYSLKNLSLVIFIMPVIPSVISSLLDLQEKKHVKKNTSIISSVSMTYHRQRIPFVIPLVIYFILPTN